MKTLLALGATGALIGTLGDQIHVQFGVLAYPHPSSWLPSQASWVPLLMAGAGILLVLGHTPILRLTREARSKLSRTAVVFPILAFYGAYFLTATHDMSPGMIALLLTGLWMWRVARNPTREKILCGLLYAAVGSTFEASLSASGAFYYYDSQIGNIPVWLPALYLHLSLLTRHINLAFLTKESVSLPLSPTSKSPAGPEPAHDPPPYAPSGLLPKG